MRVRRASSVRSGTAQLNHLPLTAEILRASYDYLATTLPFSKWNLPDSDDIGFKVIRDPNIFGCHYVWKKNRKRHHLITISERRIGHSINLIMTMAHEMVHLHMVQSGMARGAGDHGKAFQKLAAQICRIHGFDAKAF